MADAANTPTKYSRTELSGRDQPKCRVILPPLQGGWSEPALFEWELTAESWTDEHPHSEYNFVIEGQLFVECGGVTVEAQTGDVVRVPAGAVVSTRYREDQCGSRRWRPKTIAPQPAAELRGRGYSSARAYTAFGAGFIRRDEWL
jgi:mannose-6-phosphate isomerase-like protein (cupin superfamily)